MEGVCFTCPLQHGSLYANLPLGPAASKEVRETLRELVSKLAGHRTKRSYTACWGERAHHGSGHLEPPREGQGGALENIWARGIFLEIAWARKSSGRKGGSR